MDPKEEMAKLTTQFQEMWKNFGAMAPDWNRFGDLPEAQTEFWKSVMQTNQNNLDALAELNRSVAESFRTIGERQLSLFETMMLEADKAAKEMRASGEVAPEAATKAFQQMLNGMREIAEIAEKANKEALAEIEKRAAAFQDEVKEQIKKAT